MSQYNPESQEEADYWYGHEDDPGPIAIPENIPQQPEEVEREEK